MSIHRADIEIHLPHEVLHAISCALLPEIRHSRGRFVTANLKCEKTKIVLELRSDNLRSLRAAVNSHLRLLHAATGALFGSFSERDD